jgi:hypothetical protein
LSLSAQLSSARSASAHKRDYRFIKTLVTAFAAHAALALVHTKTTPTLDVPVTLNAMDVEVVVWPDTTSLPAPTSPIDVGPASGGEITRARPAVPALGPPTAKSNPDTPSRVTRSPAKEITSQAPGLEELISEQFDGPATTTLRAARLTPKTIAARAIESRVNASPARDPRVPAGEGGGLGGRGQGHGARIVTEKFAFGGPIGAFKADVCAVPPRTTARIAAVNTCEHLLTFFTDHINVPPRRFTEGFPGIEDKVEWFAIRYTGAFKVRHTGVYTFRLHSDDGSQLFIDGELVVDNDGQHSPLSRQARVRLIAGTHQLKLKYFQGPGMLLALQLFVARDGRAEKLFRPEF